MSISRKTWNVVQLGAGMCCIFFAFSSQAFIVETVLENRHKTDPKISEHAGYYSQTVIYGAFIFSNMIAPMAIKILTPKWSLVFGGSAYSAYMLGFEFLNPYYLYISAAYEGLCAGVLWTAVGHMIAVNSNKENVGRNSALMWLIYSSSIAMGGVFLLIMFGRKPNKDISMAQTRVLYGTFCGVSIVGNLIFALLPKIKESEIVPRDAEVEESKEKQEIEPTKSMLASASNELVKSAYLFLTVDMLLCVPLFFFSGLELSFWSGVYSTSLSFTHKFTINTNELMALNSIAIGCGEMIGCLAFGLFGSRTNRYGRYPIVILGSVIGIIAYILIFINVPGPASYEETDKTAYIQPNIAIALCCGGMLGFVDACINTQIYSYVSMRYQGQTTQAFSIHKLFHAVASTISMFYGSDLSLDYQLLILVIGSIIASTTFTIAEKKHERDKLMQTVYIDEYMSVNAKKSLSVMSSTGSALSF